MRAEQKREWIRLYGKDARSLKDFNGFLAPKTEPRLMTTKEMKELTKRNYKNLPEVQDKITKKKIEEEKKTNRVMSQVFAHVSNFNHVKVETRNYKTIFYLQF